MRRCRWAFAPLGRQVRAASRPMSTSPRGQQISRTGDLSCLLRAGLCQTSRMASDKSALVLLHGITMSGEGAWREVVPLLADHHQVFVPNALGHRGGPSVQRRPVTMSDVVDAAEQFLDEHGVDRPHLAGNSMGGYMAIELARRGRAATVCALSPVGLWPSGDGLQARAFNRIQKNSAMGRLVRPVIPLMSRSATFAQIRIARRCRPWGSTDCGPGPRDD